MTNILKGLALLALLGGATATSQNVQRTTVLKDVSSNPSVAIVSFSGDAATRARLENILDRCGWFNVLPDKRAANATVQIRATVEPGGRIRTSVTAPEGRTFQTDSGTATFDTALMKTVDDILTALFNVKALCSRKIYFAVTGQDNMKEIFCCYLDGTGQERVTHNNAISTEPGWGHANALVYTLARNNMLNIVLLDAGRNVQRIISRAPGLNASASLYRDGKRLALPMSAENQVDLYIVELDKAGKRLRLTRDRHVESSPTWSPNGMQLCYVSDRLGVPQLFLRDIAAGGRERRISVGNNECVSPDWSPVSNRLCFSRKSNTGQRVICVIDMADPSFTATPVTIAGGDWEAPSWAPDGRQLVCTRASAGGRTRDLYVVDSWTRTFHQVSNGAKLSLPAWRPAF